VHVVSVLPAVGNLTADEARLGDSLAWAISSACLNSSGNRESLSSVAVVLAFSALTHCIARAPSTCSSQRNGSSVAAGFVSAPAAAAPKTAMVAALAMTMTDPAARIWRASAASHLVNSVSMTPKRIFMSISAVPNPRLLNEPVES